MPGTIHRNLDRTKLRIGMLLFFFALAIPTIVLVSQAYSQLKWEAFHQHRVLAEELANRIDGYFAELVDAEEARSFADYSFLVLQGDTSSNFLQRSPLSNFPSDSTLPGLIGYFQIDAQGTFSTPLIPVNASASNYGVTKEQLVQRQALQNEIQKILSENNLMQPKQKLADIKARQIITADKQERDRSMEKAEAVLSESVAIQSDLKQTETDEQIGFSEESIDYDDAPAAPAEEIQSQAAFDRLADLLPSRVKKSAQRAPSNIGRVEDLQLNQEFQRKLDEDEVINTANKGQMLEETEASHESESKLFGTAPSKTAVKQKRAARKETRVLPTIVQNKAAPAGARPDDMRKQDSFEISIFKSEIDPFDFSILESGHLVLFRKVWRNGQRYIQGILIDQQIFVLNSIETLFRNTALSQMSDLAIAYQGNVIAALSSQPAQKYFSSAEQLSGELLYRTPLSDPFNSVELVFSVRNLPAGAGSSVINWLAGILAIVLSIGLWLMYRLGIRQISLAQQQQDFVSSVSHELKTPLTSIRMYGEMLREGWASEDKKKTYYTFIHDESERLSRLISNVLQLARMTRNDLHVDLRPVTIGELIDTIKSKITSHAERAGFTLNIDHEQSINNTELNLDADFFSQIIINLVDNAIKFSSKSESKIIDIQSKILNKNEVVFTVRDYGPGIARNQIKKIFKLFYRSENELTRETVGTGIGLALVHKLTHSMHGKVDVINREPGAEFRLSFPLGK